VTKYNTYSLFQFIIIVLLGLSQLDLAVTEPGADTTKLWVNHLLFDDSFLGGALDSLDLWWSIPAFFGYCILFIALLQLLKALSVHYAEIPKHAR
jgi:hypothetical protein